MASNIRLKKKKRNYCLVDVIQPQNGLRNFIIYRISRNTVKVLFYPGTKLNDACEFVASCFSDFSNFWKVAFEAYGRVAPLGTLAIEFYFNGIKVRSTKDEHSKKELRLNYIFQLYEGKGYLDKLVQSEKERYLENAKSLKPEKVQHLPIFSEMTFINESGRDSFYEFKEKDMSNVKIFELAQTVACCLESALDAGYTMNQAYSLILEMCNKNSLNSEEIMHMQFLLIKTWKHGHNLKRCIRSLT